MRIYNEQDEEITQEDVDYDLGYLVTDYRFVAFHEAAPPTDEVGHVRVIVTFEDGSAEWYENEEILRYKLYTEEELEEMRKKAEQIAAEEEHAQKQTTKFDEMYEALEAVKQAFPEYVPKEAE